MTGSEGRKRKLDSSGSTSHDKSAVSALAALKERLNRTANAKAEQELSEDGDAPEVIRTSNPFSLLRDARPSPEPSPSLKKARSQGSTASSTPLSQPPQNPRKRRQNIPGPSPVLLGQYEQWQGHGPLVLQLETSERFTVCGCFGIHVLKGEVAIAGARLRPSAGVYWVQTPLCHAIPVIRTGEIASLELLNDPAYKGLEKLGTLSPLFRDLWTSRRRGTKALENARQPTFQLLGSAPGDPLECKALELVSPPEWNMKLASLEELMDEKGTSKVLICGPKSSGKSTFSRLLTNRLLTRFREGARSPNLDASGIAYLDLDPGQPEFAPPGTLSLIHVTKPNLGVPFTHPGLDDGHFQVVRFHSLATVTPSSAIELHMRCATDLYAHYHKTLGDCPLLINTPGWILGLGLELLVELLSRFQPKEVIYMSEDGPSETVEALFNAAAKSLTTLPSQKSELVNRTAAHLRQMHNMSYFHCLPRSIMGGKGVGWDPSSLSSMRPYEVPYASPQRMLLGLLRYDYQISPDLIAESINGMMLAVVEIEDGRAFGDFDILGSAGHNSRLEDGEGAVLQQPSILLTPEDIPYIPNPNDASLDPRYSRTLGLALVRGIDGTRKALQILSPMPMQRILEAREQGRSIVLVHGAFDAPDWCYTEHAYQRAYKQQEDDSGNEEVAVPSDDELSLHGGNNEVELASCTMDSSSQPWVEVLRGNQKRPVGSQTQRVRRDLGRNAGA